MAEMEMHTYPASNGKGNLGVTLGAIGTGLGLLGNGINLMGMGNNCNNGMGYGRGYAHGYRDDFVNRYELEMSQALANKDAELALIRSEQHSEEKMADIYARLKGDILQFQKEQTAINTAQAVYNGTNSATVAAINDALRQITRVAVPNCAVVPGWGNVTITPAAPAVTATTGAGA